MSTISHYYIHNTSGSRRYYERSSRALPTNSLLCPTPFVTYTHSQSPIGTTITRSHSPIHVETRYAQRVIVPNRIGAPVCNYYPVRVHCPRTSVVINPSTYTRLRSSSPARSLLSRSSRVLEPIIERNETKEEQEASPRNPNSAKNARYDYLSIPMKACKYEDVASTDNESGKDSEAEQDCKFELLRSKIELYNQSQLERRREKGEKTTEQEGDLAAIKNAVAMKLKQWLKTNTFQDKMAGDQERVGESEKLEIKQTLRQEHMEAEENESVVSFSYSINDQAPVKVTRKNRAIPKMKSMASMYNF